jgi:hypothetical protein
MQGKMKRSRGWQGSLIFCRLQNKVLAQPRRFQWQRPRCTTTPGSRVELEPSGSGTGFTNFQPYTTNKLSEGRLSSCCCVSCACLGWITRVAMGNKVKTAHFMVVANIDHVCTTQEVCSTKTWIAPHLRTDLASTLHLSNVQLFPGEDPSVFYRDN